MSRHCQSIHVGLDRPAPERRLRRRVTLVITSKRKTRRLLYYSCTDPSGRSRFGFTWYTYFSPIYPDRYLTFHTHSHNEHTARQGEKRGTRHMQHSALHSSVRTTKHPVRPCLESREGGRDIAATAKHGQRINQNPHHMQIGGGGGT